MLVEMPQVRKEFSIKSSETGCQLLTMRILFDKFIYTGRVPRVAIKILFYWKQQSGCLLGGGACYVFMIYYHYHYY